VERSGLWLLIGVFCENASSRLRKVFLSLKGLGRSLKTKPQKCPQMQLPPFFLANSADKTRYRSRDSMNNSREHEKHSHLQMPNASVFLYNETCGQSMLLIQFLGRDFAHRTHKILLFLLTLRKVLNLLAFKQTDFPRYGGSLSRDIAVL